MPTIPQLPDASSVDFTDDATIILNNASEETKEATLLQLKENYFCNVHCASLQIASVDVLQLNSVPLEIVAAPGVGFAIEFISGSMALVYNSATYATNTVLLLNTAGANYRQAETQIKNTASTIRRFTDAATSASATATQLVENAALQVTVETGDPTAGDSDITVYVYYRIVAL